MAKSQATLYYDGKCPLCTREINMLRRLKTDSLFLVDVHEADVSAWQRQQMLQLLHLKRADNSWALGVEATVAAWSYTRLGLLFKPLLWPGIAPVARYFYQRWALKRARRLSWVNSDCSRCQQED
ncbi:MAG TPA: DUF393 domain-containing protein [Cellvibrionaceae bacterium]